MKILFQGDSITDAFRKPEEINPAFQLGNGYVFLIASRLAALHPRMKLEFINRGVSGQGVQHLQERWKEDAVDHRPDILSLFVGVNDVIGRRDREACLSDEGLLSGYRGLLAPLRLQNANCRFVLVEPFLLDAGEVTMAWRDRLRPIQAGIRTIAEEWNATFLPLQQRFDEALLLAPAEYWAYDGIHPTHAGFQLIADEWCASVPIATPRPATT